MWPGRFEHRACMRTRADTHLPAHMHAHGCMYAHAHPLYLCWLSRAAARPWTSVSARGRKGPLREKKRKGSGYLEGRMDGALSLPEGGDLLETTQAGTGRRRAGTVSAGVGHRTRAECKGLSHPLDMEGMRVWQHVLGHKKTKRDFLRTTASGGIWCPTADMGSALSWRRRCAGLPERQLRLHLPHVLHFVGDLRAFQG